MRWLPHYIAQLRPELSRVVRSCTGRTGPILQFLYGSLRLRSRNFANKCSFKRSLLHSETGPMRESVAADNASQRTVQPRGQQERGKEVSLQRLHCRLQSSAARTSQKLLLVMPSVMFVMPVVLMVRRVHCCAVISAHVHGQEQVTYAEAL